MGKSPAAGATTNAKTKAKGKSAGKALKVYRTSIGFHDAYVAAPSKKAALEAWGSKKDLFARGAAELVSDPELERAPLVSPGEVIKMSRGSVAEQLAALPPNAAADEKKAKPAKPGKAAKPSPPPPPKPSRAELDAAEQAIEKVRETHAKALAAIAEEEARLAERKRRVQDEQDTELARLTADRDDKKSSYDAAMRDWRAG